MNLEGTYPFRSEKEKKSCLLYHKTTHKCTWSVHLQHLSRLHLISWCFFSPPCCQCFISCSAALGFFRVEEHCWQKILPQFFCSTSTKFSDISLPQVEGLRVFSVSLQCLKSFIISLIIYKRHLNTFLLLPAFSSPFQTLAGAALIYMCATTIKNLNLKKIFFKRFCCLIAALFKP